MSKKRREAEAAAKAGKRQNRLKIVVLVVVLLVAGLGFWQFASRHTVQATKPLDTATATGASVATTAFAATVENKNTPAGSAPAGMAWIPGGEFSMGAQDPPGMDKVGMQATVDSRPIHRVYVDGFWMDKTDVTNGEFAKFVKATGYVTVAERKPRPEDYPGAPPENLVAGGVVFSPPKQAVSLDDHYQWWAYVHGANWRHPQGPATSIQGKADYPVVQVAYEDAAAYAKWAG